MAAFELSNCNKFIHIATTKNVFKLFLFILKDVYRITTNKETSLAKQWRTQLGPSRRGSEALRKSRPAAGLLNESVKWE